MNDDEIEDIVICPYTGEQCYGDPYFCEECPVMYEEEP